MKKRYFRYVKIDKNVVRLFLSHHPKMEKFIDVNKPFYVRVSTRRYPALIHHAICQDLTSAEAKKIAANLENACKRIYARLVDKIPNEKLLLITGNNAEKAKLIRRITDDVLSKRLRLRKLAKQDTPTIVESLSYLGLRPDTLKQYALFGCFKQDVLCTENEDFIKGLKIFLNKKTITSKDINDIKKEYEPQFTLFSLCMWRIVNERK